MDRKTREEYKNWKKGYYHMSLERLEGRLLFNSPEAYRMGMNSVALAQLKFDVEVYAIELMPNHLHQILSGTGQECLKVTQLFSSAKGYLTCLVKEYEAMVKIAKALGEEVEFSAEEVQDIVNTELRSVFPGRLFKTLSPEEKCRTAVGLNNRMGLTPRQLAQALHTSELAISQAIRSKDYGIR